MLRVVIVNESESRVLPEGLTSVTELHEVAIQAKRLLEVCERMVAAKQPPATIGRKGNIPYA
jgi:hypothetical protein